MYYLLYGFLYVISLLPFFILYGISDFFYVLMYFVVGYRKKVVMGNLAIAFPEKTLTERKKIARQFYKNLVDTFIESIKMISLSDREFIKRCSTDAEVLNRIAATGKNIQLHGGHQMNWEYANWIIARELKISWVGIYMKLSNPSIDKIFYGIRSRYNTVLVSTSEFKTRMHEVFRRQYVLGLAADQNPSLLYNSYWLDFFTKATPFIKGPEKGAIKNNTAVVFAKILKRKRGHYHIALQPVTDNASSFNQGELTCMYRDYLEEVIRENPSNYLWTHRRWKHTYDETVPVFKENWIDSR